MNKSTLAAASTNPLLLFFRLAACISVRATIILCDLLSTQFSSPRYTTIIISLLPTYQFY